MKMISKHTIVTLVAILFTSCRGYYVPNTINIPLVHSNREHQIGVAVGKNGLDINAASAIGESVSIMGNISFADFQTSDSSQYHQHLQGELGVGYFGYLTIDSYLEIYGGFGLGYFKGYDQFKFINAGISLARSNFNRIFIQTNVGKNFDRLETGVGLKTSYFNFYEFVSEEVIYDKNLSDIFIEPAIIAKYPFHSDLYVTGQLGYSMKVLRHIPFDHDQLILNLGLHYIIRDKY